jgi:hypothetical protein
MRTVRACEGSHLLSIDRWCRHGGSVMPASAKAIAISPAHKEAELRRRSTLFNERITMSCKQVP